MTLFCQPGTQKGSCRGLAVALGERLFCVTNAGSRGRCQRLLLLAGLCLGNLAAQALWIDGTQTFTVPLAPTEPDWSQTITVNQYNGSYYLQGIEFQLTGTLTGSFLIANPSAVYGNDIRVEYSTIIYLTRQDQLGTDIVTTALPSYDVTTVFGPSEAQTINVNVSDTSTHTSPEPASDLAAFAGSGTVPLYVWSLYPIYQVTGETGKTPPLVNFQNPLSQATITVSYLVPEPGALALAGLVAACGLSLRRRRREVDTPRA